MVHYRKDARDLLTDSAGQARSLGHSFVGSAHLLLAMTRQEGSLSWLLLRGIEIEEKAVMSYTLSLWGQGITCNTRQLLAQAASNASDAGYMGPEHILLAVIGRTAGSARDILLAAGIHPQGTFSRTLRGLSGQTPERRRKKSMRILEQYSRDLLQKAETMDPVVGRKREIETVIGILCRKNKNNPALIGETGVGKTAIAEGLVQKMVEGQVPEQLRGRRLLCLNMANLVAETKYRREFEERLRDLLAEIKRAGNVILLIDKMHSILGAGAAEGAIDLVDEADARLSLEALEVTCSQRKYMEKELHRAVRDSLKQLPGPLQQYAREGADLPMVRDLLKTFCSQVRPEWGRQSCAEF